MLTIIPVTDCIDIAQNEIRAQIYSEAKKLKINLNNICIEPAAGVKPFSIINAAFVIRLLAEEYPRPSIIYCVVNPIKEQPERIIGVTKNGILFIGRNTGAFSWLCEDFGCKELYKIPITKYVPFGGKYIYPYYIAEILKYKGNLNLMAKELNLERLKETKLKKLAIEEGTVVHVDNFGVLKLKYSPKLFEKLGVKYGEKVRLILPNKRVIHPRYVDRIMNGKDGEIVVYNGSSLGGLPEIGCVRSTAANQILKLDVGDKVCIERKK